MIDVDSYRQVAQSFLDAHAVRHSQSAFAWGVGSDSVALVERTEPEGEASALAAAREWAALRWTHGYGWIDGPAELGGAGLTAHHRRAYRLLELDYNVPNQSSFLVGMALLGPTLLEHGSPELCDAFLVPLQRGDLIACQLFSEPGAGSDLAAVTTSAERDGETWIVNGQKVWTSNAHIADVGLLLCRTDRSAPKHRGITAFLIDMDSPGVTVRPLRQISGGTGFNEVFLDAVRVSDRRRIGAVGGGWMVAMATLAHERASVGEWTGLGPGPGPFGRLTALARRRDLVHDVRIRQVLAAAYIEQRILDWTSERLLREVHAGGRSDEWLSTLRLMKSESLATVSGLASQLLGPLVTADTGAWGTYAWSELICGLPGTRLGGGSDEIVRNVIGDRLLGLPR